jgi:tellurite resistance protein
VAWRLAHARYGAPEGIALAIAAAGIVAFVLMVTGYTLKLVTAFDAVRQEFRHSIDGNLFGTVLISLLQLPIALAPVALPVAQILWIGGAAGMILFA